VKAKATLMPLCVVVPTDAHGVLLVRGLDTDVMRGALSP
jgi:hypothetical protein